MIKIGEVLVSDDLRTVEFVCHLEKCKALVASRATWARRWKRTNLRPCMKYVNR